MGGAIALLYTGIDTLGLGGSTTKRPKPNGVVKYPETNWGMGSTRALLQILSLRGRADKSRL